MFSTPSSRSTLVPPCNVIQYIFVSIHNQCRNYVFLQDLSMLNNAGEQHGVCGGKCGLIDFKVIIVIKLLLLLLL